MIDRKGDFHILRAPVDAGAVTGMEDVLHSFCFGPALVIDGRAVTDYPDEVISMTGGKKKAQRVVLCQMDALSYLIICAEGPEQKQDGGFTLTEMAYLAQTMGARQAYNLDGGSSSWLVLGEERINAAGGKRRKISDILFFVTAEPAGSGQPQQGDAP